MKSLTTTLNLAAFAAALVASPVLTLTIAAGVCLAAVLVYVSGGEDE
jgi:hypothetical protein